MEGRKQRNGRQIKNVDRNAKKLPMCLLQVESDMALENKIPEFRNNNFLDLMTPTKREIIFNGKFGYF